MNIAPDMICQLKHSFIKIRSDGTSTIRCSFVLNGTKVVQLLNNTDLEHIQVYAQDTTGSAAEGGASEVSATVAAMAAVAPNKIRSVLRARKNRFVNNDEGGVVAPAVLSTSIGSGSGRNSSAADRSNTVASPSGSAVTAKPINERAAWAPVHIDRDDDFSATSLEDISSMDMTEAAGRYIQTTKAANKCTKKKRIAGSKKDTEDWFTLAKDAHKSENLLQKSQPGNGKQTYKIPHTRLVAMSESQESVDSLRRTNNLEHDTCCSYSAAKTTNSGQVVLTAQLDFLCSIELNFNDNFKIESMVLNYIT